MRLFFERANALNFQVEMDDEEGKMAIEEVVGSEKQFILLKSRSGAIEAVKKDTILRVFTMSDHEWAKQQEERTKRAEKFGHVQEKAKAG